jgi:hypothetical protein
MKIKPVMNKKLQANPRAFLDRKNQQVDQDNIRGGQTASAEA